MRDAVHRSNIGHMKKVIRVSEDVHRAARIQSAASGQSIGEITEEALRCYLRERQPDAVADWIGDTSPQQALSETA